MRIRPGYLFGGIFFILLGGLPMLVRAGAVDPNALADSWRLWPLLLVALGIALILGRRAGLLGTALAAVVLGVAAGGALASGTSWIGDVGGCGAFGSDDATDQRFEEAGTFGGDLTGRFDLDRGSLDLSVAPGSDWRVQADYCGEPPTLELSDDLVGLRSPDGFGLRRQSWRVTLPADHLRDLDLEANASSSTLRLAGARLTSLGVDLDAGDVRIDATGAEIAEIDVSTNAGRVRIAVDSDTAGLLSANAGSMELCAPSDATLRLRVEEQLTFGHNIDDRGLSRNGDMWTRDGSIGGPVVDLAIEGNAASFTLDPEGGC